MDRFEQLLWGNSNIPCPVHVDCTFSAIFSFQTFHKMICWCCVNAFYSLCCDWESLDSIYEWAELPHARKCKREGKKIPRQTIGHNCCCFVKIITLLMGLVKLYAHSSDLNVFQSNQHWHRHLHCLLLLANYCSFFRFLIHLSIQSVRMTFHMQSLALFYLALQADNRIPSRHMS